MRTRPLGCSQCIRSITSAPASHLLFVYSVLWRSQPQSLFRDVRPFPGCASSLPAITSSLPPQLPPCESNKSSFFTWEPKKRLTKIALHTATEVGRCHNLHTIYCACRRRRAFFRYKSDTVSCHLKLPTQYKRQCLPLSRARFE